MAAAFTVKVTLFIIVMLCFSPTTQALPLLSSQQLINTCKQEVEQDLNTPSICSAFIQGYINASPAIISDQDMPSGLALRAIETRASKRDRAIRDIVRAKYCIPESSNDAVNQIATKLASINTADSTDTPEALMQLVLDSYFTCQD